MLYTRKGDDGTTRDFLTKTKDRLSKGSYRTEALGSLDEVNSFLGMVKLECNKKWKISNKNLFSIIHSIQNNLFIVQAEVAGAKKNIEANKVTDMEKMIDEIENLLPPIKTFFISGGTKLSTYLDISRTMARRAERAVVRAIDHDKLRLHKETLSYLNRLSSLLYALSRFVNFKLKAKEFPPSY
jgi:cob(I)alamin adenosyltransferase